MEYIYQFDISAFVVVCVILFSLLIRRVVNNLSTKLFVGILFTTLLSSVSKFLNGHKAIPSYWQNVFEVFYILALCVIVSVYVLYVFSILGVFYKIRQNKLYRIAVIFPYIVIIVAFILNCFVFNDILDFKNDPLRFALYILLFSGIYNYSFVVISLIVYRNLLSFDKLIALFLPIPIGIFTVIFQIINPQYNLISFSVSIQLIFIQLTVQRTGENQDGIIGVQNYTAAVHRLEATLKLKKQEKMILFRIKNDKVLRHYLGIDEYYNLLKQFSEDITKIMKTEHMRGDYYYLHTSIFCIIEENIDTERMHLFGNEIAAELSREFTVNDMNVKIEPAICLVSFPEDFEDIMSFLNFSNTFHNKIPDDGNQIAILSDFALTKDFKMKNELDVIINRALSEKNFQLYYQPIYSIKEKKYVSAEVLLRLIDVKYGFVSPALFIPAAEKSGLIHQIGDFVLEETCRFFNLKEIEKLGIKYLEVNLSTAQCIEPDLVDKVKNCLEKYSIDTSQINLEITETAADFDPTIVDKNVNELAKIGIKFSLDDYGTGYSNIKRVTSLPLSLVKLDKSFVDEISDPMMWTVIENTVTMLKQMNKLILVEGVEDEETFKAFEKLNCDYIQGYYFSKPLPEKDFIDFLEKNNK